MLKQELNVVVIGASSGIGKEVSHIFAQKGHNVICGSRDEKELKWLAEDLKIRYGNTAYGVPVDLMNKESVQYFIEKIYHSFTEIDCLVVTAGILPDVQIEFHDADNLMNTTLTNYVGIAMVLNEVSRRMMQNKTGTIICLSSVAGERGRQSNFIYGASKSALNTYLQGLRMKMYSHNVRIVTVLPGYVDTPMSYGKVDPKLAVSPQYVAKKIYRLIYSKRNIVYIPIVWWLVMAIIKLIPEAIFKRLASDF
jgi:decaprenylphospho-beta-D-erythro-pentofuranosid-2-ulose 2-reductase